MNPSSGKPSNHNFQQSGRTSRYDQMKRHANDPLMSRNKRPNDYSTHSNQMGQSSTDHSLQSSNTIYNTPNQQTPYPYAHAPVQDTSNYQGSANSGFRYTPPVITNTWYSNGYSPSMPMYNPNAPPPLLLPNVGTPPILTSPSPSSTSTYSGGQTMRGRGRNMNIKRGGGMPRGGNSYQSHRNNPGMSLQSQQTLHTGGHGYNNKRPNHRHNVNHHHHGYQHQQQQQQQHQQQQLQPISGQPPLPPPQQSPNLPPLPPGSPFDVDSPNADENELGSVNGECSVKRKGKRKPMSVRYTKKKDWDRNDALKALELEKEYNSQKVPMLILKFPDPDLSKEIVKNYSPLIENVHFQQPSTARYCFVQLKADADIDSVQQELQKVKFGTGTLIVEKKHHQEEKSEVTADEIDPYTLYIGNLPTTVSVATVKEKFPTAQRIDIGFAQRMKFTRYAFVRYCNVEEAMDAFRNTVNLAIEARSLVVRFRRKKGNVGLGEPLRNAKPTKEDEVVSLGEVASLEDIENIDRIMTDLTPAPEAMDTQNTESMDTKSVSDLNATATPAETPKPSEKESFDTKEHVLEESRKMMEEYENKMNQSSASSIRTPSPFTTNITAPSTGNSIWTESTANVSILPSAFNWNLPTTATGTLSNSGTLSGLVDPTVKVKSEPIDRSPEVNIFDTDIKEEPDYYDRCDDGLSDDGLDDDEHAMPAVDDDPDEEDKLTQSEPSKYELNNWESLRLSELAKKEVKPDIDDFSLVPKKPKIEEKKVGYYNDDFGDDDFGDDLQDVYADSSRDGF